MLGLRLSKVSESVWQQEAGWNANFGGGCLQHAPQQVSQQVTANCAAAEPQEATVGLAQAMLEAAAEAMQAGPGSASVQQVMQLCRGRCLTGHHD